MNMMQTGSDKIREISLNDISYRVLRHASKYQRRHKLNSMDAIINHGSWCIELHSGTTDIGRLSNSITTRSREECVGGDRCCAFCTDIAVYH
eukprot:scaffold3333_cov233-Chaetoceros_neogracile.AAC.2